MPRIRIDQQAQISNLQQSISDRISTGKVIPILSNDICNDLALGEGQYKKLIKAYAQYVRYDPAYLTGSLRLPHITQYVSIVREQVSDRMAAKELYLKFAKSWLFEIAQIDGLLQNVLDELDEQFDSLNFSKLAEGLGYPKFNRGSKDPLLVLAHFPLPIYLTTCHHYYIEMALKRVAKEPRTLICSWREGLESRPFYFDKSGKLIFEDGYQPSKDQPLVYHLHGLDRYPESLVLTEDDHLHFLVAISRDKGRNTDTVPKYIREALIESSQMLMGYHLRSWEFRVLFWGLIKTDIKRNYKSISVQLEPDEVEEKYLQSYLSEADFDVYRGTIYEYVQELQQGGLEV